MIGLLIVTHGSLAKSLLESAEFVLGRKIGEAMALGFSSGEDPNRLNLSIAKALAGLDTGQGVLVLTDMFGGSPSDMCMSFLSPDKVEVVTGVNLPMLLQAATKRIKATDLNALAEEVETKGIESISSAGKLLDS